MLLILIACYKSIVAITEANTASSHKTKPSSSEVALLADELQQSVKQFIL